MRQSPVEWLIEQLEREGYTIPDEIIMKAKEIEENQFAEFGEYCISQSIKNKMTECKN